MRRIYLVVPSSKEEWLQIANSFESRWNFPHALGALDGKHVVVKQPPGSGSYYYNYKLTFSVVLLAIAGPNYECLYADIGTNGRCNDGGIWNKSSMLKAIENGSLSIPEDDYLPFGSKKNPYVFLADDAFALKTFLMKPFPQKGLSTEKRIYNYRHSRGRRISENLFGILSNRWRVFRSPIELSPDKVEDIVLATLILHNYLRKISSSIYCPIGLADIETGDGSFSPGTWRINEYTIKPFEIPKTGHNPSVTAKEVRQSFTDYFMNEGAVPWQWNKC